MVEMATKSVYKLKDDRKDLQKTFGCMNGIFQLFDRRYLLGLHRKMLTTGQGGNEENGFKNSSEKVKEKNMKRVSIESSSRYSCSSSCSSTTFSSLDCSKRVNMELQQLPSQPTSPYLRKNQPDSSLPDIRDVVKSSMMTKTIRVAPIKNVQQTKHNVQEMKHVDSPRPFVRQKSVEYDRKDVNLGSRFSCDEKESKYSLKSTLKVKEVPRLSLDSKQNYKNTLDQQTHEPNKRQSSSSGVVARLMGLEGFKDSIVEVETLKIKKKPILDHELVSRLKKMDAPIRVKYGSFSVYGEMEKRLSGIEFKASGKDLRALKQILEGIKNKDESLVKPVSPTVNRTRREPVNREVKPAMLTKVNHGEKLVMFEGKKVKDSSPQKKKVTLSCSNSPKKLTTERPVLKKSTKVSSHLTRTKKQSNTRNPKIKVKKNEESCGETRNDRIKEDHNVSENNFVERLKEMEEEKPMVELPKLIIEQQSPVSVLDAFYTEDTPSPIRKKPVAFNDYETSHFDENHETDWSQVGIYPHDYSEFKFNNSTNEDHKYINEILSTSGFLNDLESAIKTVQIHPTGSSLIKPELFHFLENQEQCIYLTNDECHNKNKKSKRKLIFDSVNDILVHKLSNQGSCGMLSGKRSLNGEKLLKELCSEIDNLQNTPERCVYDEDDEVKYLVSVDLNKSQDWGKCCYEVVPGLVLDIERLIFKDLIDEVVNADVAHNLPGGRCRS